MSDIKIIRPETKTLLQNTSDSTVYETIAYKATKWSVQAVTTGTGSFTISYALSNDGINYTSETNIISALVAGAELAEFTPTLSKYVRLKITEGNVGTGDATLHIVALEN